MKLRNLSLFTTSLIGATAAQTTSAQVIIGFATANVSPVPLSPWLTAVMALMLAVLGLVFIRQKTGRGLFLLMLSVLAGGGALLQTTDGNAAYGTPVLQALGVSGNEVEGTNVAWMTPGPVCGPIGYVWVKSGAGTVSISSIDYRAAYSALDPASPPGTDGCSPADPSHTGLRRRNQLDRSHLLHRLVQKRRPLLIPIWAFGPRRRQPVGALKSTQQPSPELHPDGNAITVLLRVHGTNRTSRRI